MIRLDRANVDALVSEVDEEVAGFVGGLLCNHTHSCSEYKSRPSDMGGCKQNSGKC